MRLLYSNFSRIKQYFTLFLLSFQIIIFDLFQRHNANQQFLITYDFLLIDHNDLNFRTLILEINPFKSTTSIIIRIKIIYFELTFQPLSAHK